MKSPKPLLFLALPFMSQATPDKPNAVYLMSDELAYYELAHMGNTLIKTPVIDQFAREGIRFTQALAGSPVCGPMRCNLMTGKHAGHASVGRTTEEPLFGPKKRPLPPSSRKEATPRGASESGDAVDGIPREFPKSTASICSLDTTIKSTPIAFTRPT